MKEHRGRSSSLSCILFPAAAALLAACVAAAFLLTTGDAASSKPAATDDPASASGYNSSSDAVKESAGMQVPVSETPCLIAHAGGAVYGYRLTNSLEALDTAYENGFRHIELDISRTSDGHLVLIHDWEGMSNRMLFARGIKTREEFLSAPSLVDLTLMDIEMLISWMETHPDCLIITDVKETDNCAALTDIAGIAPESVVSRIIPQAYSMEEYLSIAAMDRFPRIILTLYRSDAADAEVVAFAAAQRPWAIVVSETRITEALVSALTAENIAVYAHTINSLDFWDKWQPAGLTGIYTDYFIPKKWVAE